MSNPSGVKVALDRLDRLAQMARETAAWEHEADQECRIQVYRHRKQFEEWETEQRKELEGALADLAREEAEELARLDTRYEARIHRIEKAGRTSLQQHRDTIDQTEGRVHFQVQRDTLQAERQRDTDLETARQVHRQFTETLTDLEGSFDRLERRAAAALRGYPTLRRALEAEPGEDPPADLPASREALATALNALRQDAERDVRRFSWQPLPLLFRWLPPWFWMGAVPLSLGGLPLAQRLGWLPPPWTAMLPAWLGGVAAVGILYTLGLALSGKPARALIRRLHTLRQWRSASRAGSEQTHIQELEDLENAFVETKANLKRQWEEASARAAQERETIEQTISAKAQRIADRQTALTRKRESRASQFRAERGQALQDAAEREIKARQAEFQALKDGLDATLESGVQERVPAWREETRAIHAHLTQLNRTATENFPDWAEPAWQDWSPPDDWAHLVRFGELAVDLKALAGGLPSHPDLALPCASNLQVPLCLTYPDAGSLLLETQGRGRGEALAAMNAITLRLLAQAPPGRASFTFIDPVGLGETFAGIMHLADYHEQLIHGRIWTRSDQIEERLAELNEHIEKVIQMYLRNEFKTISEYNAHAGVIAEKYHFLFIADFPEQISETAARRLQSIANSGARCGVFTVLHWDSRQPLPPEWDLDDLRQSYLWLRRTLSDWEIQGRELPGCQPRLDPGPDSAFTKAFIQRVGEYHRDTGGVKVPFSQVSPSEAEVWTGDASEELRVPIGRTGASKLQYLALGKGTRQHALIAGKTGSGKSTLFHVIVSNLALWCSPEEVEFYLVDFKKGVEFKCYASHRLPHARVVAIESDREFSLSVLQRVDEELRRRGEAYRQVGAQDLPAYRRSGARERFPRTLLLIDEFQEFFVEEDRIAQDAAVLLDRIVRQGRAFGIHVILGSQTLGGAYTLARTTIGQMVVRIALQCNESDAYLIMDDDNPAPRLLSRPGEGIYNDAAGMVQGNSPFQVVWLDDIERDEVLTRVEAKAQAAESPFPRPVVFEGNAPASVRDNDRLAACLKTAPTPSAVRGRAWLGEPNSIKGPTEAVFQRQSGNHLLIVGQREEASQALIAVTLVSLAAQYPVDRARFVVLDATAPDSPEQRLLDRCLAVPQQQIRRVRPIDTPEVLSELGGELETREGSADPEAEPELFVFILDLARFKKLKPEEDFSFSLDAPDSGPGTGKVFQRLIEEGPALGIHVIATCDTVNNLNRFFTRKMLGEVEMRVLFQMSAGDSATLIDSPRAGNLGLHRALFQNEQEGTLETFRPYAQPDGEWWDRAAQALKDRQPTNA